MEVNIWAVVAAAAASFLLAGIWTSPMLILNRWNKAMNRTPDDDGHPARVLEAWH